VRLTTKRTAENKMAKQVQLSDVAAA